jgi:hypothetical protein
MPQPLRKYKIDFLPAKEKLANHSFDLKVSMSRNPIHFGGISMNPQMRKSRGEKQKKLSK